MCFFGIIFRLETKSFLPFLYIYLDYRKQLLNLLRMHTTPSW